jgi:hypothetical protein
MPKVALVFASDEERDHWMVNRILKRAALEKKDLLLLTVKENSFKRLVDAGITMVVPMGEEALFDVLHQRDIFRWFGMCVPHPDLKHHGISVAPLFAPSQLLPARAGDDDDENPFKARKMRHPPRYQGVEVALLRRNVRYAEGMPAFPKRIYWEDPTPTVFNRLVDEFYAGKFPFLSWDIETPYKMKATDEEEQDESSLKLEDTILRISFSWEPGVSVSVPWDAQHLPGIERLLAFDGIHVGWNIRAFDVPHVKEKSVTIGGRVYDGMDLFHFWQSDLDRGLEAAAPFGAEDIGPWKHLSSMDDQAALYSCIDADVALRIFLYCRERLHEAGSWDEFVHQMEGVMPVLETAGNNGVYIDKVLQNELGAELEVKEFELLMEAQNLVEPRWQRKKVLSRKPKEPTGTWSPATKEKKVRFCLHCGKENVNVRHNCPAVKELGQRVAVKTVVTSGWWQVSPFNEQAEGGTTKEMKNWLKFNGFNPNSSDQMLRYMRFYGHPVGTNHKTKEDSADTKHLQRLKKSYGKSHPIYGLAIELHKVTKAKSTYVEGLRPDASERVYTTYTNTPSTWRLSSRNVNMQNQGKRESNPYAKKARKTIIPPPGMVFVQADSSAIEAVFTGYFMGDQHYIELARDGVHDYLTCKWLNIPWQPDKLDDIKKIPGYKEQRERMKRVVHGTNYGMGPYLMHMNEPEVFPLLKDAKMAQDFYFNVLPRLPQFQFDLRQRAKKEGYLVNPWGLRHYFYDVFTFELDEDRNPIFVDGKPKVKLGKDAKRVVAFKPQSSAGFFARDNITLIGAAVHRSWLPANLTVHDGYCLAVPNCKADIEGATELLTTVLTRPIPQMENLRVGCEVEVGNNWGNMEKIVTVKVK